MSKNKSVSPTRVRAYERGELKTLYEKTMKAEYDSMKTKSDLEIQQARDQEYATNIFRSNWENERKEIDGKIGTIIYEAFQKFRLDNSLDEIETFISLNQDKENVKLFAKYKALNQIISENPHHDFINDNGIENVTGENNNPNEYTIAQQSLAAYYIFDSLGIEMAQIDKSNIARLIHLLAAKNVPAQIYNSNIYAKVKANFGSSDRRTKADLEFILKHFENLNTSNSTGLNNIVARIKNDIKSYTN